MDQEDKTGFTLVEVMLVLALTAMLFIGLIAGTLTAIHAQRYNDTVHSFSEFLRSTYNEVLSPESTGHGNSDQAVLGKLIVIGDPSAGSNIYTATIVGNAKIPPITSSGIWGELETAEAKLFCGDASAPTSVISYTPLWGAQINKTPVSSGKFQGSIAIIRSPSSGTVNTLIAENKTYNLSGSCASTSFSSDIKNSGVFKTTDDAKLCVVSDDASAYREILVRANGRNSSAVNVLNVDTKLTINDDGTTVDIFNTCQ